MKKCKALVALICAMTLLFVGCSSGNAATEAEKKQDESIVIGMCFDSFVIERWQKDRDVFVSTAQSLGATVNVQNANGDVDKQIEQIEYFVEKKVDAIVIIPVVADKVAGALKKAGSEGIPVICYDRLVNDVDEDLYISFDNFKVGEMMGEAIASTSPSKVIMLCGPLTDNNVPMIVDSFTKIISRKNIEIIDTYYVEGWKAELASSYVYDNIEKVKQADAIMCGNDDIATAVIRALSVSKLAGKIKVVGQDADLPACQHIVEGTQIMTVYKPVEKLAAEAAKLSVSLAKKEKINLTDTINNGKYDVPYFAVEPIAVTKDNIDEIIIEGGFHSKEDVYMNMTEEADIPAEELPEELSEEQESEDNGKTAENVDLTTSE